MESSSTDNDNNNHNTYLSSHVYGEADDAEYSHRLKRFNTDQP